MIYLTEVGVRPANLVAKPTGPHGEFSGYEIATIHNINIGLKVDGIGRRQLHAFLVTSGVDPQHLYSIWEPRNGG